MNRQGRLLGYLCLPATPGFWPSTRALPSPTHPILGHAFCWAWRPPLDQGQDNGTGHALYVSSKGRLAGLGWTMPGGGHCRQPKWLGRSCLPACHAWPRPPSWKEGGQNSLMPCKAGGEVDLPSGGGGRAVACACPSLPY